MVCAKLIRKKSSKSRKSCKDPVAYRHRKDSNPQRTLNIMIFTSKLLGISRPGITPKTAPPGNLEYARVQGELLNLTKVPQKYLYAVIIYYTKLDILSHIAPTTEVTHLRGGFEFKSAFFYEFYVTKAKILLDIRKLHIL